MLDQDSKPTAESIAQHRKYLQDVWREAHTKWEDIDSYYNRTFRLWPEGMDRPEWFRPMRARAVIDQAVDHQMAHDPLISREPAGDGEEHQLKADKLEPALRSIMREASLLETSLTWKQAGKHLLLYGYAVIEDTVDGEVMASRRDKPRRLRGEDQDGYDMRLTLWDHKKKTMMPFRTQADHPARVLLDPRRKDPRIAIKHTYRYAIDLCELTRTRQEGLSKGRKVEVTVYDYDNPYEEVLCDEYWSIDWHALATDAGELLFVERNTWGFVPFSHAFSGYGQEPTNMATLDPSYLAVGLLDHARETLKAQAQEAAGRHNAVLGAAFNPMVTTGDASELQQQLARGDIVEVQSSNEVSWLKNQELPRYMFESEQWLDRDVELGTFSRQNAGIREQGVSTVGQQAILSTAAARRFVSPSKQLEHLASRSASHILQLIDVFKLDLKVRGHEIGPGMIESNYSVNVSFELVDPALTLQNREMGLREVQAGIKSRETYWSADARLEDASGERRRLLQDLIRSDPVVAKILAAEVAREMGILEMLEAEQQRMQQQELSPEGQGMEANIQNSLLSPGPPGGGGGPGGRPPRQPLTPDTVSPSRVGANLAG